MSNIEQIKNTKRVVVNIDTGRKKLLEANIPESTHKGIQEDEDINDLLVKAVEAEKANKNNLAKHLYEKILKVNPRSTEAMVNLGLLFYKQRRLKEAEIFLEKALTIDPQYTLAHFNLAIVLEDQGKKKEAIRHYEEAIKCDPKYADAHNNLAMLLEFDDPFGAIRHYKQYLKINPEDSENDRIIQVIKKLTKRIVVK
jgi:Tfp pilus assembly protein PilF